jgi:hypothetical protein
MWIFFARSHRCSFLTCCHDNKFEDNPIEDRSPHYSLRSSKTPIENIPHRQIVPQTSHGIPSLIQKFLGPPAVMIQE